MRVFVASHWYHYEVSHVLGVYESLEAAQEALRGEDYEGHGDYWTLHESNRRYWTYIGQSGDSGYEIEEWEVHPNG